MIRLDCTHCKTTLEMDDAFAGGVCRCQHCGTIQTVPAHLKGSFQPHPADADTLHSAAIPSPEMPASAALTESQAGIAAVTAQMEAPPAPPLPTRTEEGLQELGEVVASSGLAGSGLKSKRLKKSHAPPPPPAATAQKAAAVATTEPPVIEKTRPYLPFIAGGVVAILLALGLWLFLGRSMTGGGDVGVPGDAGITPSGGPGFCGTPISDPVVIYVLDRGEGSKNTFSFLKEATYRSIQSLGSKRKFQIIFWDNGGMQTAYPADSVTYATADNVDSARRALEDVYAFGDTDVRPALEKAISRAPSAIVLATAKGWQLDDSFVGIVNEVRRSSSVKIHTFAIGGTGDSKALQQIAEKTGGKYAEVTDVQLQAFTR